MAENLDRLKEEIDSKITKRIFVNGILKFKLITRNFIFTLSFHYIVVITEATG